MGKTYRGEKGPGYEYWGPRAYGEGKECSRPSKDTKKRTHKKSRRQFKKMLKDNIDVPNKESF